jgi:metal-responsive CopG/Arc/MetJ family transcriptional regulator
MAKRRITVDLDEKLLTTIDAVAAERKKSRNQFIASAIQQTLREIERERIDAAFARMADDPEYQKLLLEMERELAPLSEEAWQHVQDAEARGGGRG